MSWIDLLDNCQEDTFSTLHCSDNVSLTIANQTIVYSNYIITLFISNTFTIHKLVISEITHLEAKQWLVLRFARHLPRHWEVLEQVQ